MGKLILLLCITLIVHSTVGFLQQPSTQVDTKSTEAKINTTKQSSRVEAEDKQLREKREFPYEEETKQKMIDIEKREPSRRRFSSWGGKRNENDINEITEDKRSKFSSWAGKRDLEDDKTYPSWPENSNDFDKSILTEKRAKFNSWAGKRYDINEIRKPIYPYWTGKRARFNSWAGKRSENPNEKRSTFNSWAGKRDSDEKRSPDYTGLTKMNKNRFQYYPNIPGNSDNVLKLWQDYMSRKRARFSSWAGKRNQPISSDDDALIIPAEFEMDDKPLNEMEKRKFSSWGGKRNDDTSTNGNGYYPGTIVKRSVLSWDPKKTIFPWTNLQHNGHSIQTRSPTLQRIRTSNRRDRSWSSLLRPIRRGPDFYAWGGKRST